MIIAYCVHLKVEVKDVEMKVALDREEHAMEAMKRKMKDQEKEKQSEVIKLQMEVHTSDVSSLQVLWCSVTSPYLTPF